MKKLVNIHKQRNKQTIKGLILVLTLLLTNAVYAQDAKKIATPNDTTQTAKMTMKLNELHTTDKNVSTTVLFKGEKGTTIALQIKANQTLKEHTTPTPALLVCVSGNAKYYDENKVEKTLQSGNYVLIEANVKHWVEAFADSQFLLIK
jgi:quercetin dioxygenase-like cupin family protein